MKKLIALLMAALFSLTLCGCSLAKYNQLLQYMENGNYEAADAELWRIAGVERPSEGGMGSVPAAEPSVSVAEPEPYISEPAAGAAAPSGDYTELHIGELCETDFVLLAFTDILVDEDARYTVSRDHVTRTTGPEPVAGQMFVCLTGFITNLSTSPLSVYDFFVGNVNINGYNFTVDANDCDILDDNGEIYSEIPSLMEYTVRLYVAIPAELAQDISSMEFTFGFYDLFDNMELSYNRSFSDDPISTCPYRYILTL